MKKFLLGLLCGLVLAVLAGVIFVFSLVKMGESRPSIAADSTLVLKLSGDIPEKAPVEIPLPMFENQTPLTMRDIWSLLHRAAADDRIKAVMLAPRQLSIGWAKMQELRDSLNTFRKSGKPVYALLRMPGMREYYIATASDKIFTAPEDYLDVKGLRLEAMFFKGAFDKLGVEMQVEHAGKYKDAFDMFTRTSLSPESREVYNQLLDQYYGNAADAIASGRKKTPEQARQIIDQGPFVAREALAAGLIDALGYEDNAFDDLKARLKQSEIKKLGAREYLRGLAPEQDRARVALIVGEGAIMQGSGGDSPFANNEGIISGSFIRQIQRAKSDSSIKGVIVRVDSPGGDAIASDDILHEMKDLSQKKPTIISMGDVAASGGYFIAATGDPILAYPNTITGSIGVITARPNLRGLYDKLGISKEILSRGQFAAMDSTYKPMNEAERAKLRSSIDATYRGFVSRVASARKKKYEEIEPLAQGRVWLGSQARNNGLVDELGGLDRAVEMIRQKAKIGAGQKVVLVPYPPKRSLFDLLASRPDDGSAIEAVAARWLKSIPGGDWIGATLRGGSLMLMPYSVNVQ